MSLVHRGQMFAGEDPATGLLFWCPGCQERHVVRIAEGGWKWNGDESSPTIEPSVKCEQPKWDEAKREFVPDRICHSVVEHGTIRYCGDCTHALVNQIVPMVEF